MGIGHYELHITDTKQHTWNPPQGDKKEDKIGGEEKQEKQVHAFVGHWMCAPHGYL